MQRTTLITGSTSGIGKATAQLFAQKGWNVIIHGRSEEGCRSVVNEIQQVAPNQTIDYIVCELSELDQVREMAQEIMDRYSRIDALILNAGTFSTHRNVNSQGMEVTWVVNYLSRFLLVSSLRNYLEENGSCNIVDISGANHVNGYIYWEDIHLEKRYNLSKANNQSKVANILFAHKLTKELKGTSVRINSMHPGVVSTESLLRAEGVHPIMKILYRLLSTFFTKPEKAAEYIFEIATSPKWEGVSGQYFTKNKAVEAGPLTYVPYVQNSLWKISQDMTGGTKEKLELAGVY